MSYCRFSSDNFRCDVYVHESVYGGWQTHVASRRRALPVVPDFPPEWVPMFGGRWVRDIRDTIYPSRAHKAASRLVWWLWTQWHKVSMWSVRTWPTRKINLPGAGESFVDDTPGECAQRLRELKSRGFFVPDHAIRLLEIEQREMEEVEEAGVDSEGGVL